MNQMKTQFIKVILIAGLLIATLAHAESELFDGVANVTKKKLQSTSKSFYAENHFSDLEQNGVQMIAISDAMLKCKAAGYKVCYVMSWNMGACNIDDEKPDTYTKLIKCAAKATIAGVKKSGM